MNTNPSENESTRDEPITSERTDGDTLQLSTANVITICSIGLVVCFFLPWIDLLFAKPSGLELAKEGDPYILLWVAPVFGVITCISAVSKQQLRTIASLTGIIPFVILIIGVYNMGPDLLKRLGGGGYGGLGFGLGLLLLSLKVK